MRIGLHCADAEVIVALLARDSVRAVARREVVAGVVSAAIDLALADIARHPNTAAALGSITDITAEVGDLLIASGSAAAQLIRISPRPSLTWQPRGPQAVAAARAEPQPFHLTGGHNAQGDEIVPLDVTPLALLTESAPPDPRYVITGVGSLVNPDHELRAGAALLEHIPQANIEYGHYFHHTSFAVRERTAFVNMQLRDRAESLVSVISLAAGRHFPGVRLFVASNSGGSIPISRLAVTPVHSIVSRYATQAISATIRAGVADGPLEFEHRGEQYRCEIAASLPSVVPTLLNPLFGKLASPAANVQVGSLNADGVPRRGDATTRSTTAPKNSIHPDVECAVGAALLPRIEWSMAYIEVGNEQEMIRAREAAEARVHARLVATGMPPESVHTAESVISATSYGNPRVISLRIRAFADPDHLLARAPGRS